MVFRIKRGVILAIKTQYVREEVVCRWSKESLYGAVT